MVVIILGGARPTRAAMTSYRVVRLEAALVMADLEAALALVREALASGA